MSVDYTKPYDLCPKSPALTDSQFNFWQAIVNPWIETFRGIDSAQKTARISEDCLGLDLKGKLGECCCDHLLDKPVEVVIAAGPGKSGPGNKAWDYGLISSIEQALKKSLCKSVHSFVVIGNGADSISLDDVIFSIEKAKENQLPIILFINAHGRLENNDVHLQFEPWSIYGNRFVSSIALFKRIKTILGNDYPLSIFMTSCHGGGVADAALEELPQSATVVALSDRNSVTSVKYVNRLIDDLRSNLNNGISWRSSERLLYHYLTKGIDDTAPPYYFMYPHAPVIMLPGERRQIIDLNQLLDEQLGMKISESQKKQIHERLDDYMGKSNIDVFISKMENAHSQRDFLYEEYGRALAVALAARSSQETCKVLDNSTI